MILGFCVSGSTAALHFGGKVKVTNTELWNINWLMGYRDAYWYIKDTWIGFSVTNIAKQTIVHHAFMASKSWAAWMANCCL